MTPEQFVYWLQGFAELHDSSYVSPVQWASIREHLATVFDKKTSPLSELITKQYDNIQLYSAKPLPAITC